MAPSDSEGIEKFALRPSSADGWKMFNKKSGVEGRYIAVVYKIIQYTSDDLRQKLLEKEQLSLDEAV